MTTPKTPKDIDDYIGRFPKEMQQLLTQMRRTIKKAAPGAKEAIGYGIPTFTLGEKLVWFAGFRNHIGFYPGAAAIKAFRDELAEYKVAKGSVQFPFDEPLPLALVTRIVKFRVKASRTTARR